jgi:hypothetical protein
MMQQPMQQAEMMQTQATATATVNGQTLPVYSFN